MLKTFDLPWKISRIHDTFSPMEELEGKFRPIPIIEMALK